MPSEKLKFVDVLRGVAILMVVAVHHGQGFRDLPTLQLITGFGQMGVQLFFIASAYTLCRSMAGRPNEPVLNFYTRRFFRIAPLYYFGILLYGAVAFGTGVGADYYSPLSVLINVAFLHGFVPSANNSVVPGGWSIATEVTFYAVFPVLFAVYRRLAGIPMFPLFAVGIAWLLNFTLQMAIVHMLGRSGIENNTFLYYSILNQLPVFLIGMFLFFRDARSVNAGLESGLAVLFIVAAFAAMNWPGHISATLSPTLAGIGFAFLFVLARRFIETGGLIAKIGQVSYSMYLFHFVFAWWLSGYVLGAAVKAGLPLILTYVVTLAITILCTYWVAVLSKLTIEDPLIAVGRHIVAAWGGRSRSRVRSYQAD